MSLSEDVDDAINSGNFAFSAGKLNEVALRLLQVCNMQRIQIDKLRAKVFLLGQDKADKESL
tara:strand:- start:327 stop:512 length:186 start_codon:yes stop_codon:yes gene_type:complete